MLDIIGQCEGPKGQKRKSVTATRMSAFGVRAEADFGRSARGERRHPLPCRAPHSWLPAVGVGADLLSRIVTPPEVQLG